MGVTALVACAAIAQPLIVADDGNSEYVIYHAPDAPRTVQEAAAELARVLEIACGARLPVVQEPATPMISLGENEVARAAGFTADELPEEGFLIAAADRNLFILGPDTPDGALTRGGGCSQGTLFGVYEFLERFVDVRWLMPGELGEDIPPCPQLRIEGLPLTGAPDMAYRMLPYIHNGRSVVREWGRRQRLGEALPDGRRGCALWLAHNHVWQRVPDAEIIRQNPEFAALVGDRRVEPEGEAYKLCTTNPGLIEAFADGIMQRIAASPDTLMFSISPSDGGGWCECENCMALDEPTDPQTWPGSAMLPRNMTRRLGTFYNAVARIVGQHYPDKLLGAYLYYEYAYPSSEPMEMEPNLFFVLATRAYYGATLYRRELAEEFPRLMAAWNELLPGRVAYYDLPTKLIPTSTGFIGAPQPTGIELFNLIFPALKANNIAGAYFYGMEWWGTAGAHNYVAARLMYDNDADPKALRDEWLARAYGPAAAVPMSELDEFLEAQIREYKQNPNDWQWRFMPNLVTRLYQPHFASIEQLYRQALELADTPARRQRLELFGDNLTVLHWNLRQAGMLANPRESAFYLTDADYTAFAQEKYTSLALLCDDPATRSPSVERLLKPMLFVPQPQTLQVPRAAFAPVIDGDLSDAAWDDAAAIERFLLMGSGLPAARQTTARLMFDDDYLYMAIMCHEEDMANLVSLGDTRDDDAVWTADSLNIFLTPPVDASDESEGIVRSHFWHLIINPDGQVWDALGGDKAHDLPVRIATGATEDAWTVEIALPLDALGFGNPSGRTWKGNLCRQQHSTREQSSWSPVAAGFVAPEYFGTLKFAQ